MTQYNNNISNSKANNTLAFKKLININLYQLLSYIFIPIIAIFILYINDSFFNSIQNSKLQIINKKKEVAIRLLLLTLLILVSFNFYFMIYNISLGKRLFFGACIVGILLIYIGIRYLYDKHKIKEYNLKIKEATINIKKPHPKQNNKSILKKKDKLYNDILNNNTKPNNPDFTFEDVYCNIHKTFPTKIKPKELKMGRSTKQLIERCQILV